MSNRKPEIKNGVNKGARVYWVHCPRCGNSPEVKTKISARLLLNAHDCERGWVRGQGH